MKKIILAATLFTSLSSINFAHSSLTRPGDVYIPTKKEIARAKNKSNEKLIEYDCGSICEVGTKTVILCTGVILSMNTSDYSDENSNGFPKITRNYNFRVEMIGLGEEDQGLFKIDNQDAVCIPY